MEEDSVLFLPIGVGGLETGSVLHFARGGFLIGGGMGAFSIGVGGLETGGVPHFARGGFLIGGGMGAFSI